MVGSDGHALAHAAGELVRIGRHHFFGQPKLAQVGACSCVTSALLTC